MSSSSRLVVTILVVLLIGIALGVAGLFVVQSMHLFNPATTPKPSMHW